jgi:signal transduction histidine kinase
MKIFTKSATHEHIHSDLFQSVNGICSIVNTAVNESDLLSASLKQIMQLFGAGRGSIFILHENGKDLILKSVEGMKKDEEKEMIKLLGEGIVGQVAKQKIPICVENIENDARFHDFKARKSYRTPSFICAPLIIKDALIGVINISDKETGLHFDKNEMQVLDFLSSQIALNYRRIQLYQRFKTILRETQTLKDKLGQSNQEAEDLKRQVFIQERLATIGKLAGGIAHEFNNPLDGVMRYTNLCLEHTKDDEIVRGYLLEIKEGLNRMANIVKNLLACSRNDTLQKSAIDFNQALDRSLDSVQMEIDHKNIHIRKDVPGNMPPIPDLGLERILTNILRNAVDAIQSGGEIAVCAQYQDDILHIKISDTGIGISKDDMGKIFEPFYTTKPMDKGCGLGLTIVSEIIKAYNGTIHVESRHGAGTTFFVNLPAHNPS